MSGRIKGVGYLFFGASDTPKRYLTPLILLRTRFVLNKVFTATSGDAVGRSCCYAGMGPTRTMAQGVGRVILPNCYLIIKRYKWPGNSFTILELPFYGRYRARPSMLGLRLDEILNFFGVAVVWYLVGRLVDRQFHPSEWPSRMTVGRAAVNVLAFFSGVCVFVGGALPSFRNPWLQNNPRGYLAQGVLLLAWSAALIVVPTITLLKGLFQHRTVPRPRA